MTYLLDGRLIEFYENNRATAKSLRDIIRQKGDSQETSF